MPNRSVVRRGRALRLPLLALALVLARPAAAQECTEEPCGPLDFRAPTVTLSPASHTRDVGSVSVAIDWADDYLLVDDSRSIVFTNGGDVTGSFTYTKSNNWTARSTGTVTLPGPGSFTLTATICDPSGNCGTASATYTVPSPSVRVSAHEAAVSVAGNTVGAARFRVVNTGSVSSTYALSGSCPAGWGTCAASSASATVAGGDSVFVDVGFAAPPSGTGAIQLAASTSGAAGSASTTVTALAAPDPGYPYDARSLEQIERDACVFVGLGGGAAQECGDLVVVHPLPSVRGLNASRTPMLVYNHHHARPYLMAAAHVAPRAGTRPDTLRGYLRVGTTVAPSRRWAGWPSDTTKRVVVGVEAYTLPTGIYPYTLEVVAEWNGSATRDTVYRRTGKLVHVNHNGSAFGAGWWLEGVERLYPQPGDSLVLWVGGDGSARIYRGTPGDTLWTASAFDRRETLRRRGSEYVRPLPGGTEVWFSGAGYHLRTVNRLGHRTELRWNASGQLTSLVLPTPPAQTDTLRYLFEYGTAVAGCATTTTGLTRVASPAPGGGYRYTSLCADGSRRVSRITDPDGQGVDFAYASTWLMTRRTDRRGGAATFAYGDRRLTLHRRIASPTDTLTTSFSTGAGLGHGQATLPANLYLFVRNPRGHFTYFWLGAFGAITRLQNAAGQRTVLERGDPRWPGLVTRTVAPNGFETTASYDDRGKIASSTAWNPYGDGRNATTTYRWDPVWERPTLIVAPEGETVSMGYDAEGRRAWEQPGPSTTRRTSYYYYPLTHSWAPGLVEAVSLPNGGAERFEYDTRGNLQASISPLNGTRTEYLSDNVGRVTRVRLPAEASPGVFAGWQADSAVYDAADRVQETISSGPAMNGAPAQELHVRTEYDAEGNVKLVDRWSNSYPESGANIGYIRTEWVYDLAGRPVVEIAADGMRDSTVYDKTGNPIEVHTRRTDATGQRLVVRMQYDGMNRLTQRQLPQVQYASRDQGIPAWYRSGAAHCTGAVLERTYPHRPNDGGCGYRVDAQTETYVYDIMGNLTRADNADAQVRRSYYRGGALATDTLRIRTVTGSTFTSHVYVLGYQYDRNGRRTQLSHPGQLAPAPGQSTARYGYDPATGALASVTDPMGNEFRYEYNGSGELTQKNFVGAAWDQFEYWADGTLSNHATYRWNPIESLRYTSFTRDAAGRILEARSFAGRRDSVSVRYSGLGQVVSTGAKVHGDATSDPTWRGTEQFTYDAMGNQFTRYGSESVKVSDGRQESYTSGNATYGIFVGRLSATSATSQTTSPQGTAVTRRDEQHYDGAGNVVFTTQDWSSGLSCSSKPKADADCEDRASFYAADGRLRAADHRVRLGDDNGGYWRATFEEYRYDALGRRVWVRTRMECTSGKAALLNGWPLVPCYSTIRRTVWDGAQELWEIQMPGSDTSSYLENDVNPLPVRQYINWYPDPNYDQPGGYDYTKYSWYDPNPLHGRVGYTHGLGVDQPLSLMRIGLNRYYPATYPNTVGSGVSFAPFAAAPSWDWRGNMDGAVYPGGASQHCEVISGASHCVSIAIKSGWHAYSTGAMPLQWHGTLVTGKSDGAGTLYRRARYYDPATGRFTQEDPTGLAGGVNLYGYAGGDPVNFADPSGEVAVAVPLLIGLGGAVIGAAVGGVRGGWAGAGKGAIIGGLTGLGAGGVAVRIGLLPATVALTRAAPAAGGVLGETAVVAGPAAAAGQTFLPRGMQVLAVVDKTGKIIAQTPDISLSHAQLIARQLGGVLPEGAQVITVVKSMSTGRIGVVLSRNFHPGGGVAPRWVLDAMLKVFQ